MKNDFDFSQNKKIYYSSIALVCMVIGFCKETGMVLWTEKLTPLFIPSGFGSIGLLILFLLTKYSSFLSSTETFSTFYQICISGCAMLITFEDSPEIQILSLLFIYVFTILALIFLDGNIFMCFSIHAISVVLDISLILSPSENFVKALFISFLNSLFLFFGFFMFAKVLKNASFWKAQSLQTSFVSANFFTFFPEITFLYNDEKGIFYKNEAAENLETEQSLHFSLILEQMKKSHNGEKNLFDDVQMYHSINHEVNDFKYEVRQYFLEKNRVETENNALDNSELQEQETSYIYEVKFINYTKVMGFSTVLVIMVDITQKIEKEKAEFAAQNKNTIMCSVSHEVRTPLNHIFGIPFQTFKHSIILIIFL
jgi:hypothetical protein